MKERFGNRKLEAEGDRKEVEEEEGDRKEVQGEEAVWKQEEEMTWIQV